MPRGGKSAPHRLGATGKSRRSLRVLLGSVIVAIILAQSSWSAADLVIGGNGYRFVDLTRPNSANGEADAVAPGQQVGQGQSTPGAGFHALLWQGTAASVKDLNPTGYVASFSVSTDGLHQVGSAFTASGHQRAAIWSGTSASAIDITPAGFTDAALKGIAAGHEAGVAWGPSTGGLTHAMLWTGNSSTATDLQPPTGFRDSGATGISDTQEIGSGTIDSQGQATVHALLWSGTAASAVDLNPNGYDDSIGYGVVGGQQVGSADFRVAGGSVKTHAILWHGTSQSAFDLNPNPTVTDFSIAFATNGEYQVGVVGTHAVIWHGSANSMVDLQQLVPSNYTKSEALGIDAEGDIVGWAFDPRGPAGAQEHPVAWLVVPEPGSVALLAMSIGALTPRRRSRTADQTAVAAFFLRRRGLGSD